VDRGDPLDRRVAAVRSRCKLQGLSVNDVAAVLVETVPEVSRLEAHRLAREWTRPYAISGLASLFRSDGMQVPTWLGPTRLYEWERRRRHPGPDSIDLLCRLYASRPDLLGYGRDYTTTGQVTLERPPLNAPERDEHRISSDSDIVESLRAIVDSCRRLDHRVGPKQTLGTVLSQSRLVESVLAGNHEGQDRGRLFGILAELQQLAGWMMFDLHDFSAARVRLEAATASAREAGDDHLLAYILGPTLGFIETYAGRPDRGIDLTQLAYNSALRTGNSRLTAFVLTIGARAHAKLGQDAACRDMLSRAEADLSAHRPSVDDPKWLDVFDSAALLGHRGSCLLDLGYAADAVAPLGEQEAATAEGFVRNRTLWRLDRACSYRGLAEVEQACAEAVMATELVRSTTSTRARRRLHEFAGSMRAWRSNSAVRELNERIVDLPLVG
jgi:hypothetical protein